MFDQVWALTSKKAIYRLEHWASQACSRSRGLIALCLSKSQFAFWICHIECSDCIVWQGWDRLRNVWLRLCWAKPACAFFEEIFGGGTVGHRVEGRRHSCAHYASLHCPCFTIFCRLRWQVGNSISRWVEANTLSTKSWSQNMKQMPHTAGWFPDDLYFFFETQWSDFLESCLQAGEHLSQCSGLRACQTRCLWTAAKIQR